MRKVINFISKRYNVIFAFILGSIITGTSAYAITVASNTVTYDNTNSGLTSTNVQGAIDELYTKSNKLKATVGLYRNTNIVKVMKYDQDENSATLCITGNEATCEELAPTTSTTYDMGTIVDYKINNSTTRRFYVIHDDGAKLTLQDQKNIVDNVAYATKSDYISAGGNETKWNSCIYRNYVGGCNDKGPVTILPTIETATSTWTNVNLQTYTPGTTSFFENNKTGCTSSSCNGNTYTMDERNGRGRAITVPEVWATGCDTNVEHTCPKYMYNYLLRSDSHGGTITGNESSSGYWTMNAHKDSSYFSWYVDCSARILNHVVVNEAYGARAVVVINK